MGKIIGPVAYVLGALMIIGSVVTWILVSSTLADQNITVSDDGCLGGQSVTGPFTAYCQALVIDEHARDATGGLTYAELDREDPLRAVAMNAAFLQSSLFTSVLAFGVAAMAFAIGVLFVLLGGAVNSYEKRFESLGAGASAG
ncbi:MAG: aromatic ring-opening dioxygenase LigA [Acidimicrobiia bacterium]